MPIDPSAGLFERFCVRCGARIEPGRRRETCFHAPACKQAWYRAKQKTHESENLTAAEQQFRHCRKRAHFYRLAILIDKTVWMYPPRERPSVRFDGVSRATPGFLVTPYEPPVVPIKGRYSVLLFDAEARPVAIVEGCSSVRADPLWRVSVESGEQGVEP